MSTNDTRSGFGDEAVKAAGGGASSVGRRGSSAGAGVEGKRGSARWGPFVVAGIIGGSLGVAGFTFDFAEGLSYLSEDPNACVNCHVMQEQFDGWRHASHHAVATCNDCHVPHDSVVSKYAVKAEHGYRHSKGFTLNDFHEPIQITPGSREVVIGNCERCHAQVADDLSPHGEWSSGGGSGQGNSMGWGSGGMGGGRVDCLRCHSRVGHGVRR